MLSCPGAAPLFMFSITACTQFGEIDGGIVPTLRLLREFWNEYHLSQISVSQLKELLSWHTYHSISKRNIAIDQRYLLFIEFAAAKDDGGDLFFEDKLAV
ncbi:hypothetical protein DICVIV_03242 [Dictyocaulus viviparus]|uniref:Uncharacterized protein n=1 Tax=Dictyocaulus viviparus TaxID=29172 RepID=A0A0D8Y124_DICVI|nr:hypothetical protein DICVIV_03242 [Dictyocaulus viviparus]